MQFKKVYLVDDNPTTLFLHQDVVSDVLPFSEIISYEDSEFFIKDFLQIPETLKEPVLLLLDINMPIKTGYDLLEELEEANFDELLDALGTEVDDEESDDDSALDVNALLQEPDGTQTITADDLLSSDDDFLDVEALLDASLEDESEPMASKDLNLSAPLADYFGDIQQGNMVDVDGDDGFGAKLDLAQAYIEIGEHESATELLEEIIKNGSKEQKEEAEKVLNSLS